MYTPFRVKGVHNYIGNVTFFWERTLAGRTLYFPEARMLRRRGRAFLMGAIPPRPEEGSDWKGRVWNADTVCVFRNYFLKSRALFGLSGNGTSINPHF
jgi:hypothetical protein